MGSGVRVADLDRLCGEVLPDRVLLSVVTIPTVSVGDHGQRAPSSGADHTSSGGHDGHSGGGHASEMASCTTASSPGTPGLVGTLGLGQQPYSYTTCTPSSVSR